jgi:acetyltransferase-like isoleucine patch superfamily enzyme
MDAPRIVQPFAGLTQPRSTHSLILSLMNVGRTLPWDWYPGRIPDNVVIHDTAYCETSFSFFLYRSQRPGGVTYRRGASTYLGTMFDVGPQGRVELGEFALVHGARIICDAEVLIGDYALISWNVVFMDTYRLPFETSQRRKELRLVPTREPRFAAAEVAALPIRLERNVWIGFDACVLPGVTIGEGSVIGAKSVVTENVPAFTVVAGNPARVIRRFNPSERGVDTVDRTT